MALIDTFALLGCGAPCSEPFGRDQLLKRMDALGITHSIVASSLALASDFETGNETLAKEIEGQRRLLGHAVVNTNHPAEAIESIRNYMSKRQFVGLLLIEGDPDTPVSGADAYEILNAYRRFGKPLMISAPSRECVYAASQIAKEFDQMRIVLLGMGGKDWRSAIAASVADLNVFLQTTGEISPDKIRDGWEAVNGNRIMFASGAPSTDPAMVLGMIAEVGLSEREREQLLAGNAERTFSG